MRIRIVVQGFQTAAWTEIGGVSTPAPAYHTAFPPLSPPLQLYLPRSSLDTDVTTAKSSGVNIIVLAGDEDGGKEAEGPAEAAVPEQFVTRFRDGAWVTTPVSHSGA